MSLIGLVNLAERLFNQTQGNLNEDAGASNRSAKTAGQALQANHSDEFRPSGANAANEAGLFQVTQQSVFAAGASVLLVQPSAGGATGNATAAAPASAAGSSATTGGTVPNTTSTTTANAQSTDNAQVLAELQSLNDSLAALGLSGEEIAAVDRVAQLIKDFSPAAFTSLIGQLKVLSQDTTQSTANANAPSADAANTNATNRNGTAQNGGFSIQELSIKFAGVNETVQQGQNTLQISAFQLQVSEVNLTLNNAATGQTAQIQAPQAAANTTNGTAPVARAATA